MFANGSSSQLLWGSKHVRLGVERFENLPILTQRDSATDMTKKRNQLSDRIQERHLRASSFSNGASG